MTSLCIELSQVSTAGSHSASSQLDYENWTPRVALMIAEISAKSKFSYIAPTQHSTCTQVLQPALFPSVIFSAASFDLHSRVLTQREDLVFRKATLRSAKVISMGKLLTR